MGPYLSAPIREKEVENGEGTKVSRTAPKLCAEFDILRLKNHIGEIRSMRDAGMEKYNGGLTYCSDWPR